MKKIVATTLVIAMGQMTFGPLLTTDLYAASNSIVINNASVTLQNDVNANGIANIGDILAVSSEIANSDSISNCDAPGATVTVDLSVYGGSSNEGLSCGAGSATGIDLWSTSFTITDASTSGIEVSANDIASAIVVTASDIDDTSITLNTNPLSTGVDTRSPAATIDYNPPTTTGGSVVATLTGASESIVVTNNSGSSAYTFTENGSFTFEFVDLAGNTGSVVASVAWIIDTTPPVVTLSGSTPMSITVGNVFTDPGATWTDNMDGSGSMFDATFVASGTVDTNTVGQYIIEYIKIDTAGNSGSLTRTVNVIAIVDTTAPIVTVVGSGALTVEAGTEYTDSGASWTDNVDGSGSTLDTTFVLSGSVNTTSLGVYILEYIKTDSSGNTGSAIRTITVQDTTLPSVTLSGTTPMSLLVGTPFIDPGATWTDNLDGSGTIATASSGSVDINTLGTYLLEYTYVDSNNNTGSIARTVNIIATPDTTPPVVTLSGSTPMSITVGNVFTDPGATWTDNMDGSGSMFDATFVASGTVDTNTVGQYIIEYIKIDTAGNSGSLTRTVNVIAIVDTTPPTASVVYSNTGATNQAVVATLTGASESITVTNNSGSSVYTFTGNGSFTFEFIDAVGNTGSVVASVNNIDVVAPTASVEYTPSTTTSGSVVATLTGASESIVVTNNSGSSAYTFTEGGSFTFEFVDLAGNTGSVVAVVTWIDRVAPTASVVYSNTGATNQAVVATLTGASESITVTNNSGSSVYTFTGNGSFTFEFIDAVGNTGSVVASVNNIDVVAPTIVLIGSGAQNILVGNSWSDLGAMWNDNIDGSGTVLGSGAVDTSATGTYIVSYSYTDRAGNTISTTRTIYVIASPDTTPPTLILNGSGSITVAYGSIYNDAGATCIDNTACNPVTTSGSVNTSQAGTYVITYSATDIAGNTATGITRTVVVGAPLVPVAPVVGPGGGGGGSTNSVFGTLLFDYKTIGQTTNTPIPPSIKKTLSELISQNQTLSVVKSSRNKGITRGEFVYILSLIDGYDGVSSQDLPNPFKDISTNKYKNHILYGVQEGWINPNISGFRASEYITIGEVTKLINAYRGIGASTSTAQKTGLINREAAYILLGKL